MTNAPPPTSDEHGSHSASDARGLEVCLRGLLQHQLLQCQVRHRPAQSRILPLKILQATSLIRLQAAVLTPPSIVALLRYPDLATDLANRATLREPHIRFTQVLAEFQVVSYWTAVIMRHWSPMA